MEPNLPRGRISKLDDGMKQIKPSGHNLVRVLDSLYAGATSGDIVHKARCTTLYEKFASFVRLIDPATASGQTTGIEHRIDDSVNKRYVRRHTPEG